MVSLRRFYGLSSGPLWPLQKAATASRIVPLALGWYLHQKPSLPADWETQSISPVEIPHLFLCLPPLANPFPPRPQLLSSMASSLASKEPSIHWNQQNQCSKRSVNGSTPFSTGTPWPSTTSALASNSHYFGGFCTLESASVWKTHCEDLYLGLGYEPQSHIYHIFIVGLYILQIFWYSTQYVSSMSPTLVNIIHVGSSWAIDRIEEHALTTLPTMPAATFPAGVGRDTGQLLLKATHQLYVLLCSIRIYVAPMQIH